ncbi:hypothetical protein [Oscillibacter sp.]|uniref:hypothetical protein n=1 Tax=Oscillibacter sp. TaxID=1945593 RepID=UPI00262F3F9B|nr:hypothetical protein [Oscillibacter sp.]MDD3347618.1 hypothetical protein [Oscillibacter sp.]
MMQLVGQAVKHKTFGPGVITDFSNKIVTICFSQGDKKFIYPDAFISFLTLKDQSAQSEITAKWDRRLQEENAQQQRLQEEQERRQRIRTMKIAPNSQAAFHVDGTAIDQIFASGAVSSGCYLSGSAKGEPRIPSRLKPNSACLLTECPENSPEQRRIVGAFMVEDDFFGDLCGDGMVKIHSEHRLYLHQENSLMFWNYFDHGAVIPRWGSPVFKYFSNSTMQQILFDVKESLADTEEGPSVDAFYEYFCSVNRLPEMKRNA